MGISTETREHAVAPVRDRLMELIAEQRPKDAAALREFAAAYLRRLSADAAETMSPEELLAEVAGAFDFAATRGERPILVRAFNPSASEHGYVRSGSVLETNTEDLPFLVDSVRAELLARGLGIQRVLHPVVGLERDEAGRITHVLHPREASARESVMHFDLDRRLDEQGLEELADEDPLGARRRPPRRARLPGDGRPRPPHGADRRRRRRPLRRRRGRRDGRVPRVAAAGPLHLPRLPRVQDRRREHRRRPRIGPRHPRRRGLVEVRPPAADRLAARGQARARARGRPADRLQDEPAVDRAPARAHGLRRRAQGLGRRAHRRRGAHARPLHHQGLRRAGLADAAAEPQAAPDPAPRGPDRGLARLQGRRLAVRLVPEGRAVLRHAPTTCGERSSRCCRWRATRCGCSAASPPTAARRR